MGENESATFTPSSWARSIPSLHGSHREEEGMQDKDAIVRREQRGALTPIVTSTNAIHSFAASLILCISSSVAPSPCRVGIPAPAPGPCDCVKPSLAASTPASAPCTCVGKLPNTPSAKVAVGVNPDGRVPVG